MNKIFRMIDVNLNRISEGIRVLEDISRLVMEYSQITADLRESRHTVRKLLAEVDDQLILSRNASSDIGRKISGQSTIDSKKDIKQLVVSNFKRVEEGLRSIEESLKIVDHYQKSKQVENLRFRIYEIEKRLNMKLQKPVLPEGIYGITAEKYSKGRNNIEVVKKMVDSGIKIIQYREKHGNKNFAEMFKECRKILTNTQKNDVVFIVNDYIELAKMVGADGVHIGQQDFPVEKVRDLLPDNKILGLSTHSPKQAQKAVEIGVDYIGVGPIFETNTKQDVVNAVGLEYLDWVEKNIDIPYVAIGGIKEHNLTKVVERGARTVALVTEIVGQQDIQGKVRNLNKILHNNKGE